jgi:hypothetical protein
LEQAAQNFRELSAYRFGQLSGVDDDHEDARVLLFQQLDFTVKFQLQGALEPQVHILFSVVQPNWGFLASAARGPEDGVELLVWPVGALLLVDLLEVFLKLVFLSRLLLNCATNCAGRGFEWLVFSIFEVF